MASITAFALAARSSRVSTALLPIVVKQDLQASAGTYGLLLGCIGAGAIAGAMVLPGLRTRLDPDRLVLVATLAYAGCTLGVALLRWIHLLYAVALLAGIDEIETDETDTDQEPSEED